MKRSIIKILPLITPYQSSKEPTASGIPFKSQIEKPKPKQNEETNKTFFL
jgi:hypothetical protein